MSSPAVRAVDTAILTAIDLIDDACAEPGGAGVVPPSRELVPPLVEQETAGAISALESSLEAHRRVRACCDAVPVIGSTRQIPATGGRTGSLQEQVLTVGRHAMTIVSTDRERGGSLTAVLSALDTELIRGTGSGWSLDWDSLSRTPRYELRAFLDPGAGPLWSANDAARRRWDHPADHHELPLPAALVTSIDELVNRYAASIPAMGPHRPFPPAGWSSFRMEYREALSALGATLGPAYVIRDEEHL